MQYIQFKAYDFIAIEGEEAKKFLQGQVTCDIDSLSPSHSIAGALCNIKGRVVSDFRLVEYRGSCYILMAAGMADIVKPVLDKYMVFSRAVSRLASGEIRRIGLLGDLQHSLISELFTDLPDDDTNVIAHGDNILLKIPGITPRHELWQFGSQTSTGDNLILSILEGVDRAPEERWILEDIQGGVAHITPSHSDYHLPEALNYDLNGIVSFTKGCYTGQEIVARMHYRGTAKKRLFCGVSGFETLQPESITCISSDSGVEVTGEIINSAHDDKRNCFVLAVLPSNAAEANVRVFLNDDPALSVRLKSLPYIVG